MAPQNDPLMLELFKAVDQNDSTTLRELLRQGGNPDQSYENLTNICLLHIACEKRRMECLHVLLEAGANIRKRDDWGLHPVMFALISRYYDVAEILLSLDPYIVDIQDRYGKAPLHTALESDCVESVKLLLRYDCDVNCFNSNGTTPLMTLCKEPDLENRMAMFDLVLSQNPNLERMDFRSRRTALQYAVIKKNIEVVELLLGAGANPNTVDMAGRTPLTNVMWENVKIYDPSKGIDPEVMMIIILLIQSGAELNFDKVEYGNPLVTAAFLEAEPLIRYLLDSGCNPDTTFRSGVTALLVSVIKKDPVSTKALLQWSCKSDTNGHVYTKGEDIVVDPFELAVENGSWDIVEILVNSGYQLNKHSYIMDECYDGKIPERLKNCPEMLQWLRHKAVTPMSLCHLVLLKLWRMLKSDTETKLAQIPLPNQFKQVIISGDFLVVNYI